MRAREIVAAIGDAAARWCDADFPARIRATRASMERTGYTEPVVDYALDRLFSGITPEALTATIVSELGSLAALDGFVERAGRPAVFYRGIDEVAILSSNTTLGVAIPYLVFALCAKARVTVKDRADRLVAAFAETLVEERAEFEDAVRVESWPGADPVESPARIGAAGVVVAFGRAATLRTIRAQLAPDARFIPFGHRTSIGYVSRDDLPDEAAARAVARAAALDALLYDGEGCLSLHALFVEQGAAVDAARFTELAAAACDDVAIEFPSNNREPAASALAFRNGMLFRTAQGQGSVHARAGAAHVVAFDPRLVEPPPLAPRTLVIYPVDGPESALAYLREHELPLEAFACASVPRPDVLALAVASGAARIARLGALQDPPPAGNHGGESRILPFVRAVYRDPFPAAPIA